MLRLEESRATAAPPSHRAIDPVLLTERARFLDDDDRYLLDAALRGLSSAQIAHLAGLPDRRVRHRLRRLTRHLCSRGFVAVMRALRCLPPEQREIAVRHHLRRHSLRRVAGDLGIPLHRVRRSLAVIDGVLQRDENRRRSLLERRRAQLAGELAEEVAP